MTSTIVPGTIVLIRLALTGFRLLNATQSRLANQTAPLGETPQPASRTARPVDHAMG